jgi:hypothetical protein
VTIANNARIAKDAKLVLGDGNNIVNFAGDVKRSLQLATGGGVDSITIANTAKVARDARFTLGSGDDSISNAGMIGRNLTIDGGAGADTYTNLGGTAKAVKLSGVEVVV